MDDPFPPEEAEATIGRSSLHDLDVGWREDAPAWPFQEPWW